MAMFLNQVITVRLKTTSVVLLSVLLTGCIGYLYDMPHTVEVSNPIPLVDEQFEKDWGGPARWACQPATLPFEPLAKSHFRQAWGEPHQVISTTDGEIWVYEETGRWCGLWFPIPLALPVCETFDRVTFEADIAVSSYSRRFSRSSLGVVFHPELLMFPVPFSVRPGGVTENAPGIAVFPEKETDTSCELPTPKSAVSNPNTVYDAAFCLPGSANNRDDYFSAASYLHEKQNFKSAIVCYQEIIKDPGYFGEVIVKQSYESLGLMYEIGLGVEPDADMAKKYYKRAGLTE